MYSLLCSTRLSGYPGNHSGAGHVGTPILQTMTIDTTHIEAAARALLDDKIGAVRDLAATRQTVADRRAQLDEAERADTTAYAAAQRAGWTPEELKKVGLDAPTRKAPGRPRRTRPTTPPSPTTS